jgi:putative ATPase
MRPQSLAELVGQEHLVKGDGPIASMVSTGLIRSAILWGPPGTGKTTIGRLLAAAGDLELVQISAVGQGVQTLRKAFGNAAARRREGRGTLLFVDEIHRFNRGQQDALLPAVEDGTVTLIGATTENPSFEVGAALLSRCRVLTLRRLEEPALEELLRRAEARLGGPLALQPEARAALLGMADGDGRILINLAEDLGADPPTAPLDRDDLRARVQARALLYDRKGDQHYDLISALHKSVRGSDPDASLYWLARMLAAGENPRYVGRRLIRMAAEDVGLAAPDVLVRAVAAFDAYERLGSPEGELALAQVTVELACAPKSNAVYTAYKAALDMAGSSGSLPPPLHIRNAPTALMRDLGYGAGYAYDHDSPDAFSGQNYFPDDLPRQRLYRPTDRGQEQAIRDHLARWEAIRSGRTTPPESP